MKINKKYRGKNHDTYYRPTNRRNSWKYDYRCFLVDLGANPKELKEIMESVTSQFGKVKVSFNKVNKCGIDSTYCNVELLSENKHIHYKDLISKIDNLELDEKVKETSKNIF